MATAAVTKAAIANGLRSAWPVRNAQSHKARIVIAINDTVAKMTGDLSRVRW
jgi:predicted TIM-barrel fold metal-dependent hydrolase